MAEEGRAARNLIAWSVPLENKEEEGTSACLSLMHTLTHTRTRIYPKIRCVYEDQDGVLGKLKKKKNLNCVLSAVY